MKRGCGANLNLAAIDYREPELEILPLNVRLLKM